MFYVYENEYGLDLKFVKAFKSKDEAYNYLHTVLDSKGKVFTEKQVKKMAKREMKIKEFKEKTKSNLRREWAEVKAKRKKIKAQQRRPYPMPSIIKHTMPYVISKTSTNKNHTQSPTFGIMKMPGGSKPHSSTIRLFRLPLRW